MSQNLKAMLRYRIIDQCLRRRERQYGVEELAEEIRRYFYEELGINKKPSRRTIIYDIEHMKSGNLGFIAPIEYSREKKYHYTQPRFSIYNVPLQQNLLQDFFDALEMVRRVTQNERLFDIRNALDKLEESLHLEVNRRSKPLIYLEHSPNEPGQRWLDKMYQAIKNKEAINLHYIPFNDESRHITLSPYFIKEYNNRWYVVGWDHRDQRIINPALDRIQTFQISLQEFQYDKRLEHDDYFRNVFGVTVLENSPPQKILFEVKPLLSKYIGSKPIHPTQKMIELKEDSTTYSIEVGVNYEILHHLLSFGPDLKVVTPPTVAEDLKNLALQTAYRYAE